MKNSVLFFICFCFSLCSNAQTSWQWGSIGGSPMSSLNPTNPIQEWMRSMAVDKNGNTYAIVQGVDKIYVGSDSSGFTGDAFSIVSWACDGKVRWIKTIGPSFPGEIGVDTLGGVYITGRMDLISGNYFDTDTIIPAQSQYKWNYIVKYDSTGSLQWLQFPDMNLDIADFKIWPYYTHMQVTPGGDIHLLAYLSPGLYANGSYAVTDTSYQIIKMDKNGQFLSAVRLPMNALLDNNGQPLHAIVEAAQFLRDDVNDRYYFAGTVFGPMSYPGLYIGNDTLRTVISAIFAASFSSTGQLRWLKQQDTASWAGVHSAAVDNKGQLFLSGQITNGNTWNQTVVSTSSPTLFVAYVACMDSQGVNKWISKGYSPDGETPMATAIGVNTNGTVGVSGQILNRFDWGNFHLSKLPPPGGVNSQTGIYVAQLDINTGICSAMDSVRTKYGYGINAQFVRCDAKGNFFIGGGFSNPPGNIDTLAYVGAFPLKAIGGTTDFYLAKYGQANCPGQSTTGVEQLTPAKTLYVFPNPTNGVLNIGNLSGALTYTISDPLGRIVAQGICSPYQAEIDLRKMPSGLYFLHAVQSGKRTTTKILKQ